MGRLIDADALIEVIEKSRPLNWTDSESELQADFDYRNFADMVREQPTAYDIEKVVAELEGEVEYQDKKADEADVFEEVSESHARISMMKCYEHAIEIVKAGGTT